MALIALLLAALGAYQYLALQHNLVQARADTLIADVKDLRAMFYTEVLRADRAVGIVAPATPTPSSAASPSASPHPRTPVAPQRQATAAQAERMSTALCLRLSGANGLAAAEWPDATPATLATAVQAASGARVTGVVYDHQLVPTASQPGSLATVPRMDPAPLQAALNGHVSASEVISGPDGSQVAIAVPIGRSATQNLGDPTSVQPCGVLQVSAPTQQIDSVLAGERFLLLLGGAGVLVLVLVAGVVLTGRALRPLRRLSQTAGELARGNLRARSRLTPRSDEVGELAHSFDDMATSLEAAFAARTESEAQMRRFIADASHELRTPVTALKGYIDVIRRGAARDPGALAASLEAMARESDRMRTLVLDLLTLARIDSSRAAERQALDLNEVLASVLDEGVPGMPEQLERRFADAPVVALAERTAVVTIARNLLVNACKYAPGAAQVWATWREAGRAVFSVSDRGPGIPPQDLPHVFERFFRGEKTRAREEGGSGLGLSIVDGLARAQGGGVAIESAEARGTTVTVWFPDAPPG